MATVEQIKKLRDMTGAGVNSVREALDTSGDDLEKALAFLRQKGMAKSEKRKDRAASNGVLGTYIHSNNRVVVVVEVNCETDFAAKSADMLKFANDIALQVAATNPRFISVESIPENILNEEKETYLKDLEGKPEEVKTKILDGKLEKFYSETVLMKQVLFTDESKTVEDYLSEMLGKIGEKIVVKSFTKFEVAQDITSCSVQ